MGFNIVENINLDKLKLEFYYWKENEQESCFLWLIWNIYFQILTEKLSAGFILINEKVPSRLNIN